MGVRVAYTVCLVFVALVFTACGGGSQRWPAAAD
jgi:hypothetical protein